MARKRDCDECRTVYSAYDEDPPCGDEFNPDWHLCEFYETRLYPENYQAWEVYRRVHGQTRMSGEIDINAVYETMDRMNIPDCDQLEILDLVKHINRLIQKDK